MCVNVDDAYITSKNRSISLINIYLIALDHLAPLVIASFFSHQSFPRPESPTFTGPLKVPENTGAFASPMLV